MAITRGTPVEYFSATEQSPHTLTLPTFSQDDVVVIAINSSPDGTAAIGTITIPSGWTEVDTNTNTGAASDSKLTVIYRVMQGGDSTTLNVSTSTSMTMGAVLQVYTGVDTGTPEDATAPSMSVSTGNPVSPSITTVTNDALLICFAIIDAAPGFVDASIPSGMTLEGTMANNPPSNGMNLGMASEQRPTLGATGTRTWSNGGTEEHVAATMALRPAPAGPTITSVDTDNDVDDEQDPVIVAGSLFGATDTGSADVEIGDNAVYASANRISQVRNSWSDTSISIVVDLGAQSPGTKWMWVTDSSGTLGPAFQITVHRCQGWVMSASADIPASGANTTARLTAPATKTTGDFDAGRIQDDENPADAVNITADNYTEMVWSIEAQACARDVSYSFRVTKNGEVLGTYTVTPQTTVFTPAAAEDNAPFFGHVF